MDNEQPADRREPAPMSEDVLASGKTQGETAEAVRSREQQVKRSPLPSARELAAAIAGKYGCEPYRE
jgi:hypothetical protein